MVARKRIRASIHGQGRPRHVFFPEGEHCKTKERFANGEPVPGSLARTCPEARSHVDFVQKLLRHVRSSGLLASSSAAHFAQDDTPWRTTPGDRIVAPRDEIGTYYGESSSPAHRREDADAA